MKPEHASAAWSAFPNSADVKLWIGSDDNLTNALNLYHPYSFVGRCATALIRRFPGPLARRLFTSHQNEPFTQELTVLSHTIRATLDAPDAAVSFSSGTAGPHQKLTAQVTTGGKVIAYVKIGNSEAVATCLRRESEMLRRLHTGEVPLRTAGLPTVIATRFSQSRTLLFLSAPPRPGKKNPLIISEADVRFLEELGRIHRGNLRVDQWWERMGSQSIVQQVFGHDERGAGILRDATATIEDQFKETGITVSCIHGDYSPWNTLTLADGSFYVFDWEYGEEQASLGTDLFHRLYMPNRLVQKLPPHETVLDLLGSAKQPQLAALIEQMAIPRNQLPGYLLLYLLGLALRETPTGTGPSSFILESMHCVLMAAGHSAHRRKVLVAAYACEPNSGSEPGVGWNMCQAIAQRHDAWVITRANNRDCIERMLAVAPNPHLHFTYTDLPRWASFWKKKGRGVRLYYYLWQFAAWREARRLQRSVQFDMAHHVTFVNDWLFTFLALLPLPYVWGPIGSHPKAPWDLTSGWGALVADRGRYYFQACLRLLDPLFWLSAARAGVIIGINRSVVECLPLSLLGAGKFFIHPAIGVEKSFEKKSRPAGTQRALRLLSMGRLVPIKAFHLTIKAFAMFAKDHQNATLIIVGRGPEQASLETLATQLQVRNQVTFVDWLPRAEALEEMRKSDLFVFPSFEGGGMVVLEALAHGLPVVCLKYGGPGDMVSDESGRLIPVGREDDTVSQLAEALSTVLNDQNTLAAMSAAAQTHITKNYLWADRSCAIQEWYGACAVSRIKGRTWSFSSFKLLLLGLAFLIIVPVSSLADRPTDEILRRYQRVAGSHHVTIKNNRAEFNDGRATWTILGAHQAKGNAHRRPSNWTVDTNPFQILTVTEPISDTYILPYSDPVPNSSPDTPLDIIAARGEREPASFVIRSGKQVLQNLVVVPPTLKREGGNERIASDNIDIRLVKAWYQASNSIHRQHGSGKILVSELLLHDSDLVRVDHDEQVNLIRNVATLEDAERLLPFSIPPQSNQQIWLTVSIPSKSLPGRYRGNILITMDSEGKCYSTSLPLTVTILPFALADPPIDYALYYLAWLSPGTAALDARAKTTGQLRAELHDMLAHGLTNVAIDHNYVQDNQFTSLAETLEYMREAGFKSTSLLYVDWKVSASPDADRYSKKLKSLTQVAQAHGFADIFVYNLDEQDSQTLLKNRPSFEIAHAQGAKNFVAFNSGNLDKLGGLLDMAVLPRGTVKTVSLSKKVSIIPWAYGDPQAGEETPFTYRNRYGINLWLDGFDGACDYAYQSGSFGWDDWADPKWRSHNMTYPTLSTPIPTLQWEGFREAIDDARYLATAISSERRRAAIDAAARRRLFSQELGTGPLMSLPDLRNKLITLILTHMASTPGHDTRVVTP